MRQMAENALRQRPPLNWLGALDPGEIEGRSGIDLKLQGTALFVDVARIYALAHGLPLSNTRARLEAMGRALHAEPQESQAWVSAFEFLQMLRLRLQMEQQDALHAPANWQPLDGLNEIDRRMLKESLRIARRLQQRLELDYLR